MAADLTFELSALGKTPQAPGLVPNATTVLPAPSTTTPAPAPPYYYGRGRGASGGGRGAKEPHGKVLSKQEIIEEYYAAYDVMTGIRIGATLGGLIALFTLFLVYKSKCRAYREASHKAREKARMELEETRRMEHFQFANRSAVLGSRRYYHSPAAGVARAALNRPNGPHFTVMPDTHRDSELSTSSPSSADKDAFVFARQNVPDAAALLRPRQSCFAPRDCHPGSSALSDISTSSSGSSAASASKKSGVTKSSTKTGEKSQLAAKTASKADPAANKRNYCTMLPAASKPSPAEARGVQRGHEQSLSPRSVGGTNSKKSASSEETAGADHGSKVLGISHCNPLLVYQRDSQASTSGESAVLNLPVSTTEAETSSGDVSLTAASHHAAKPGATNSGETTIRVIIQKEE